jgi:hypothetical protein
MDTRKAGRMGGKRRAERMTPKERSQAASKAALARWEGLTPEERSAEMRRRAAKRKRRVKREKDGIR